MKIVVMVIFSTFWHGLSAWAAGQGGVAGSVRDLTQTAWGHAALLLFVAAYLVVIMEERLHLRKSKPVMLAAGWIWILVAVAYRQLGIPAHEAHQAIQANILEYAELMLFLLVAMTYINALEERNVFQALRCWLVSQGFSLRTIFWITGLLSFCISPVADNLTTALLMAAVVMAVAKDDTKFVALCCINIVVAANAGGAFSPFGDITTLMVWQKGRVTFGEFFVLLVPALINWLVPAVIMSLAVAKGTPQPAAEQVGMKFGARRLMALFLVTIATAVCCHNFLELPPVAGMMLGLSYFGFFAYYIKVRERRDEFYDPILGRSEGEESGPDHSPGAPFDIMRQIARAEWDTLLFFYGVILCVGGLAQFGYLALVSRQLYTGLGPTLANILVGIISAVVDNIPVMFVVLTMDPTMAHGQWLLVTLTAGVGGSLLSIGSAAGVGLMGVARGSYTFGVHLKWTPVVALGYAASIYAHLVINRALF
jgi:NhaD family Na+/H+ antiporter